MDDFRKLRLSRKENQPRMNTNIHEWRQKFIRSSGPRKKFVFIRVHWRLIFVL